MMDNSAQKYHDYAERKANKYIRDNWGSMALDNINFDVSLYDHWLQYYDAVIDQLTKQGEDK